MISRADRGPIASWWWTVDRWFIGLFIALMAIGAVMSFAASPSVAERIGLNEFHFVKRQFFFLMPAFAIMIGVSLLSPRLIRRLALLMLVGSVFAIIYTLFAGVEVKGSRRWISLAGLSLQPSEFLKPAFVVICAWLFAENERQPEIAGNFLALVLLCIVVALLIAQPDIGQTILIVSTWGAMFFAAGLPWLWIIALMILGIAGGVMAYSVFPHVAGRINRFLTGEGDTYQTDTGLEAIMRGGWFGQGPGEGTVKRILPDSHTDFVFAVVAEEFGIIICAVLVVLFAAIVIRGLTFAFREDDGFSRYAVCGLVTLFGFQSIINMAVNLRLMPAKGMTLPFISYGGSSLLAIAISMGMVLALTRKRPFSNSAGGLGFTPKASQSFG